LKLSPPEKGGEGRGKEGEKVRGGKGKEMKGKERKRTSESSHNFKFVTTQLTKPHTFIM